MFLKIQVQMNISCKRAFTHFLVYKWLTHTFYMCASLRALRYMDSPLQFIELCRVQRLLTENKSRMYISDLVICDMFIKTTHVN